MGVDRWIDWREDDVPDWGPPTLDRVAQVAEDFLGPNWEVSVRPGDKGWIVCETKDKQTFHLRSEYERNGDDYAMSYLRGHDETYKDSTRGFEICFFGHHGEEQTSVITRQADRFTSAIADELTRILAQWWGGDVRWPS